MNAKRCARDRDDGHAAVPLPRLRAGRRVMPVAALCALAGSLAGAYAPRLWIVVAGLAVLSVLLGLWRGRRAAVLYGVVFVITLAGAAYAMRPAYAPPEGVLLQIDAEIVQVKRYTDGTERLTLDGVTLGGTPVDGGVYVYTSAAERTLDALPPLEGMRVSFVGGLRLPKPRTNPYGRDRILEHRADGVLYDAYGGRPQLYGQPAFMASARETLRLRGEALFGENAALVHGMLLGGDGSLDEDTTAAYRDSGIIHLLTVSGMHIMFIYGAIYALLRFVPINVRVKAVIAIVLLAAYCALAGWKPPVLRAFMAACYMALATIAGRRTDTLSSIGVSFVLILCASPMQALNMGFRFSFACVAGIWALNDRLLTLLRGLPKPIAQAVALSLSAQAGFAPFAAYYFGTVTLWATVTNVLVTFAATVVVLTGALSHIVYCFWPFAAAAPAFICGVCADFITSMAHLVADAPLSVLNVPAPSWIALPAYAAFLFVCSGALRVCAGKRREDRGGGGGADASAAVAPHAGDAFGGSSDAGASVAPVSNGASPANLPADAVPPTMKPTPAALCPWLALCALVLTAVAAYAAEPRLPYAQVIFLDVGQANSAIIRAGGATVMVDVGSSEAASIARRVGADALMITHIDSDHARGAADARADALVLPMGQTLGIAGEHHMTRGDSLTVGALEVEALWPPAYGLKDDTNEEGLALRVDTGAGVLLFPGDIGAAVERKLAAVPTDVLCVSHHGSRFSSSELFLERMKPGVAIVSVGAHNNYGHPAPDALERLEASGARVLRTDRDGAITINLLGDSMEVYTYRTSAAYRLTAFLRGY